MRAVILDAKTLGDDISLQPIASVAELITYPTTTPEEIAARIENAEIVIVNKVRLNESNLAAAKQLRLICVAATGYDNIDTEYCRLRGIAVCNVLGYSTHSVAQLTVSLVLSLMMHLPDFSEFVRSGAYTDSGVANRLYPAFHELYGKTWGVVGAGNIGGQVARIAEAFGCRVIVCRRTKDPVYTTVDIDTLCREADIITLHTPLTAETKHLISADRIASMKDGVILVNVARGAVTDEQAVANAVSGGKIGGFGCDVYSAEPLENTHPFYAIRSHSSVCLTPHMAWGAIEARQRCMEEIAQNIAAFEKGDRRCRVV